MYKRGQVTPHVNFLEEALTYTVKNENKNKKKEDTAFTPSHQPT